jgi:hypothetical protein
VHMSLFEIHPYLAGKALIGTTDNL